MAIMQRSSSSLSAAFTQPCAPNEVARRGGLLSEGLVGGAAWTPLPRLVDTPHTVAT